MSHVRDSDGALPTTARQFDLTVSQPTSSSSSSATVRWQHYDVLNMGCEACAVHVQSMVSEFEGVVQVSDLVFETGLLSILVRPDLGFDEEALKYQLGLQGYELDNRSGRGSSCSSSSSSSDHCSMDSSAADGSRAVEVWSHGRVSTFRLLPGMDLKQELRTFVRRHGVRAGSVLSCVGSLRKAALRLATGQDGSSMKVLEVEEFFEITSLTGTVAYEEGEREEGERGQFHVHLHMTLSDAEGRCVGGHVLAGNIIFTTAEVTLLDASASSSSASSATASPPSACGPGAGVRFSRKQDPTTGFRELVVLPA